jgi:hypothetical protein
LLVLAIMLLVVMWKRLSAEVRAYGVASILLLLGYICFYARYTYWAGDFAWGDRYVSTSVEMVALIAVPLLIRLRFPVGDNSDPHRLKPASFATAYGTAKAVPFPSLPRPSEIVRSPLSTWLWRAGIVIILISLVIQIASLAFWLPLEIYQMETLGHPTFVIALRFKNIAAFALGKMEAWGLNNESMGQDPWDYIHITCWNFLPFLLRRIGAAPRWVVDAAFAIWFAGIAGLLYSLARLRRMVEW